MKGDKKKNFSLVFLLLLSISCCSRSLFFSRSTFFDYSLLSSLSSPVVLLSSFFLAPPKSLSNKFFFLFFKTLIIRSVHQPPPDFLTRFYFSNKLFCCHHFFLPPTSTTITTTNPLVPEHTQYTLSPLTRHTYNSQKKKTNNTPMSDLKTTKDTLVSTLFELSKAAQDAANAAIEFYKVASGGSDHVSAEQLKAVSEALNTVATLSSGNGAKIEATESKKKRKQEKDPNAPKKPLTMFFQFSYDLRKKIGIERKKKDLPSLSAIDMNSMIKDRWDSISEAEKAGYKKRYDDAMIIYNIEKKKYEESLKDGSAYYPPPSVQTPIVGHGIEQDFDDDATDIVSSPEEPKKKKKKTEKKEKKKKSGHGSL